MQDLIGYDEIIESSMRSVIYETLKKVEKTGLPGSHYFVVTFLTRFPDTVISKILKDKYPEEMTIAIQYQYRGLKVDQDSFQISLSFGGKYETLKVPFKAITSFADPSMNFALKFTISYDDLEELDDEFYDEKESTANKNAKPKSENSSLDTSAKVISLDAFRNKDKD